MNLILDFGNSNCKIAVFDEKGIQGFVKVKSNTGTLFSVIDELKQKFPKLKRGIISSVIHHSPDIEDYIKEKIGYLLVLAHNTPLPIKNLYQSTTIGKDRLAAVVGANNIYKNTNVLVVDVGTAIKFDVVNDKNEFIGGNISPGIKIRFKSLNQFTQKLPLLSITDKNILLGRNTEDAIIAGVQNSVIFETRAYIRILKEKHENLKIIFTGGDAAYLSNFIDDEISLEKNLVLIGLNVILNYNDKAQN